MLHRTKWSLTPVVDGIGHHRLSSPMHINNSLKHYQNTVCTVIRSQWLQESRDFFLCLHDRIAFIHWFNCIDLLETNIKMSSYILSDSAKCQCFCLNGRVSWDTKSQEPHISEVGQYPKGRASWDTGAQDPYSSKMEQCPQGKVFLRHRNNSAQEQHGSEDAYSAKVCSFQARVSPAELMSEELRSLSPAPSLLFFASFLLSFLKQENHSRP